MLHRATMRAEHPVSSADPWLLKSDSFRTAQRTNNACYRTSPQSPNVDQQHVKSPDCIQQLGILTYLRWLAACLPITTLNALQGVVSSWWNKVFRKLTAFTRPQHLFTSYAP